MLFGFESVEGPGDEASGSSGADGLAISGVGVFEELYDFAAALRLDRFDLNLHLGQVPRYLNRNLLRSGRNGFPQSSLLSLPLRKLLILFLF
ncbi:hypothetical protein TB2_033680 [Malus domestica]